MYFLMYLVIFVCMYLAIFMWRPYFQDLHSSAWYLFIASSRAFGFWLDLVCFIYIALVTLSFLFLADGSTWFFFQIKFFYCYLSPSTYLWRFPETYGGNVGFAITQAIGLTGLSIYQIAKNCYSPLRIKSNPRFIQKSSWFESED